MKNWIEFRRAMRVLADAKVAVRVEIEDPKRRGMALGVICRIGQVKNGFVELLGAGPEYSNLFWRRVSKVEIRNHGFERLSA